MTAASRAADEATTAVGGAPAGLLLGVACIAQFMVVLDVSIVNVALPAMGRNLHYSATGLQWVVNAYVLTFAGFLLLGGRAADLFGWWRLYLVGLAVFSAASLLGGFALNSTWLTLARAAQGIGGAALSPATLTIIVTTFPQERRAKALGVWSAVAGSGGAVGSILGGVLTAELSWRFVLFVNLPIALLALAGLLRLRGSGVSPERGTSSTLDVAGAVSVTLGLSVLVYAIVGTDVHPWASARTLWTLAFAVGLLALFAFIELRVARAPLVPFRLFASRTVSGANLVMCIVGAAFFSMWYFLSLYLQNVRGFGALRTGVAFLPMAVVIIVGAQLAARLLPKTGPRPLLLVGTALAAAGFAWLAGVQATGTYWGEIFGPGMLITLALGLLFTPLAAAATAGVAARDAGLSSGVLNTSRQIGGSLGLAALATAATSRTRVLLVHHQASAAVALTSGYARAFALCAALGVLALGASAIVPRLRATPH